MLCLTVECLTNFQDDMETRFLQGGYDNPTISFAPHHFLILWDSHCFQDQ